MVTKEKTQLGISDECFGMGMMALEARTAPVTRPELGEEAKFAVMQIYRQTLNVCLTDATFSKAVQILISTARYKSFPSAEEIIEASHRSVKDIGLSLAEIALREWNALAAYRVERDQEMSFPISPAGRYAAQSVGGIRFICDKMASYKRSEVRRDFIASHQLAVKMGHSYESTPVKVLKVPTVSPPDVSYEPDPEAIARAKAFVLGQQQLRKEKEKNAQADKGMARVGVMLTP